MTNNYVSHLPLIPTERTLATATPIARLCFNCDLQLATKRARTAVTPDQAQATASVWTKCWPPFLAGLGIEDPLLHGVCNKISLLQVFAERLQDGRLSRSKQPVRGDQVSDEIFHVAKTFTNLGAPDPRLTEHGQLDPRLTRLFTSYQNKDLPPSCVRQTHAHRHPPALL